MLARPTSQSVWPAHAQPNGEQREGVDEVYTDVDQTLEYHHHQAQLQTHHKNTNTHKTTDSPNHISVLCIKHTFPTASHCFTHQSKDQVIQSGGGKQKQQDGEEQSPQKQLHGTKQN